MFTEPRQPRLFPALVWPLRHLNDEKVIELKALLSQAETLPHVIVFTEAVTWSPPWHKLDNNNMKDKNMDSDARGKIQCIRKDFDYKDSDGLTALMIGSYTKYC